MKLYEYQAKTLFERFRVTKPDGRVAATAAELPKAIRALGKGPWALKAQILAGGRGKAGGIKLTNSLSDAKAFANTLLGRSLVTHQTGPNGEKVAAILIEKTVPTIVREMYVGILLDRRAGAPVVIASAEGGMDIETLARENPEAILRFPIDVSEGFPLYRARLAAKALKLEGPAINEAATLLARLWNVYAGVDATLVEVNPLVLTEHGRVIALDGKIIVDDNALYRHPELLEWKNRLPQPAAERKASKANISYIKLDGNVGCLVNGAGLAMATMDIIKLHGGEPANFLDVGGGASEKQVTEAFKIILSDPRVEGILVNIFGGIMRCDVIAQGIIAAVKQIRLKVPLVVRLEGTNSAEGKKLLAKSKLPLIAASGLSEAAQKIVDAVWQRKPRGHSSR